MPWLNKWHWTIPCSIPGAGVGPKGMAGSPWPEFPLIVSTELIKASNALRNCLNSEHTQLSPVQSLHPCGPVVFPQQTLDLWTSFLAGFLPFSQNPDCLPDTCLSLGKLPSHLPHPLPWCRWLVSTSSPASIPFTNCGPLGVIAIDCVSCSLRD